MRPLILACFGLHQKIVEYEHKSGQFSQITVVAFCQSLITKECVFSFNAILNQFVTSLLTLRFSCNLKKRSKNATMQQSRSKARRIGQMKTPEGRKQVMHAQVRSGLAIILERLNGFARIRGHALRPPAGH
ncbi:MAG: hypothetical protein JNM42_05675 [Propionivibrio sp.]|uniref:hypothetical protein n=1 Tax=Propionivibrio sp. TaxID=2212460 RepID=UPI001A484E4B|nr:hypothetical protein [Propionivibrio sp.]MBL8413908.1 hypothetical protein [Propionivibrio sp.]